MFTLLFFPRFLSIFQPFPILPTVNNIDINVELDLNRYIEDATRIEEYTTEGEIGEVRGSSLTIALLLVRNTCG